MTRLCLGFAAWIWILASFLVGCATVRPVPGSLVVPGSDEAAAFVWKFYGAPGPVPKVRWLAPDCTKPSGKPGVRDPFGRCKGGWTITDGIVTSIWIEGGTFSGDTALAHELRHAAQLRWNTPIPHHVEVVPAEDLCGLVALAPAVAVLCERHRRFLEVVDEANRMLSERNM